MSGKGQFSHFPYVSPHLLIKPIFLINLRFRPGIKYPAKLSSRKQLYLFNELACVLQSRQNSDLAYRYSLFILIRFNNCKINQFNLVTFAIIYMTLNVFRFVIIAIGRDLQILLDEIYIKPSSRKGSKITKAKLQSGRYGLRCKVLKMRYGRYFFYIHLPFDYNKNKW